MADTKISALTAGNPALGTDILPVARSGTNVRVTAASIAALASAATLAGDTDVAISAPALNDGLSFDSSLSKWLNRALGWYSPSPTIIYQDLVTDLSGWTAVGTPGVVSSAVELSSGVTSILEQAGHGNQYNVGSSLAGLVISFYVNVPAGNSIGFFLFGCDSSGNGAALGLSGGYSDTRIISPGSWAPGPPGSGSTLTTGWHLIVITIDALGTHASWTVDGTPGESSVAITLGGNYIGLSSNASYGSDFYFSQIKVEVAPGESWTTSRTVAGGVSTLEFAYSGPNTPVVKLPLGRSGNPQTASYVAALGDANNLVTINNASGNTFTVPPHSSIPFALWTTLSVIQIGAGQVTLTPGAGVTLNTPSSLTTRAQWSTVSMVQIATDVWVCGGDLT